MQVDSPRKVNDLISNLESLVIVLRQNGHDVEWRAVEVGESLDHFDHVIVSLMPMASWGSRYMGGALWAIWTGKRVTLTAEDWQVRGIWPSFRGLAKRYDYFEKTIWSHWEGRCSPSYKHVLHQVIRAMSGKWPYKMLVPCWHGGDLARLGLPADELISYDPSACMKSYDFDVAPKCHTWIFASLTAKDTWLHKQRQSLTWPVLCYGNVRKDQQKLPESALQQVYASNWGVMSPPHDVSAAGWFRVRFHMAAQAGCVMLCGADEARVLGDAYAHSGADYEKMSDARLENVALDQAIALNDKSWTPKQLYDVVNRTITS